MNKEVFMGVIGFFLGMFLMAWSLVGLALVIKLMGY